MSAAEIIAELPKRTPEERKRIVRRVGELEEADEMLFLDEAFVLDHGLRSFHHVRQMSD